ncbi:MAG TPA: hypothetical protein PLZ84_06955, partial [Clostridia bacterium]|nr:hypothetical protein [Clostridia bacterium]
LILVLFSIDLGVIIAALSVPVSMVFTVFAIKGAISMNEDSNLTLLLMSFIARFILIGISARIIFSALLSDILSGWLS